MTEEEKAKFLEETMRELDEMLEAHERYKEEYGRKRANLTLEEIKELDLKELRESYEFAVKSGMAIETIKIDGDEHKDEN